MYETRSMSTHFVAVAAILLLAVNLRTAHAFCSFEYNIDYNGNDINITLVNTLDDCCTLCYKEPRCRAWTFVAPTSMCFLKNETTSSRRLNSDQRFSGVSYVFKSLPMSGAADTRLAAKSSTYSFVIFLIVMLKLFIFSS